MNSNDTLLCHLIATDEMQRETAPKLKTDHLVRSPKMIEVAANEIVYIHHIHCKAPNFIIAVTTPTTQTLLKPENTIDGSNNTIIKGLGTIHFTVSLEGDFFVQYVRIIY